MDFLNYKYIESVQLGISKERELYYKVSFLDCSSRNAFPIVYHDLSKDPITGLSEYPSAIPSWTNSEDIYSASVLDKATIEQQYFYFTFKDNFLSDVFFDLKSNQQYAQILIFDLIGTCKNKFDVELLSYRLACLEMFYPRMDYQHSSILHIILRTFGLYYDYEHAIYYRSNAVSSFAKKFGLDKKYKDAIGYLKFYSGLGSIEFFRGEIVKLFFVLLDKIDELYKNNGSTLRYEIATITDNIARKKFRFRNNSKNYLHCVKVFSVMIYQNIFYLCDNEIRTYLNNKRMIKLDEYCITTIFIDTLGNNIFDQFIKLAKKQLNKIDSIPRLTEIELNVLNPTRWKVYLLQIIEKIDLLTVDEYMDNVINLALSNMKSKSFKTIYFEAAKHIAAKDKLAALKLYFYFVVIDLQTFETVSKKIAKNVQKLLFANIEQHEQYEQIISTYTLTKNYQQAYDAISVFYIPKRKTISVCNIHIGEVLEQHSQTVDLLNEYLVDEDVLDTFCNAMPSNQQIERTNSVQEPKKIKSKSPKDESKLVGKTPIDGLLLTEVQIKIITLFIKRKLVVKTTELANFAKKNGFFATQLIDSVNDACYEVLDDLLIEESGSIYKIDDNYLNAILK